ncbi:MAG: FAD-dependent oxidoreductase [Elusimicrobia bacterium]|nr:FAD-dependent oxidoreductase [Elusimicrobiota bacterium]
MRPNVLIVGGGVMGVSTAYWLTKMGRSVQILDRGEIPNSASSSGDHVRVFHLTHGKDAFYTDLAAKSLPLWLALNEEAGERLFHQNGMLELAVKDGGYEDQSYRVLQEMNLRVERMDKPEIRHHHPMFDVRPLRFAVFHHDAGFIWAMRTVAALSHLAQKKGAKVKLQTEAAEVLADKAGIRGVRDRQGKVWQADHYLFTAGPWTGALLKKWRLPLKVTRQEQMHLMPPTNRGRYRPEHFPVFAVRSAGLYGFPIHIHGFLKLSAMAEGAPGLLTGDAATKVSTPFERKCRSFLKKFLPDLAGFTEMEGKLCCAASTPDKDFIMDRLPDTPNGFVAAGFSTRGMKFSPLVGKTMAELIVGGRSEVNLHRFRVHRFHER